MDRIHVRPATEADVPTLQRWRREAADWISGRNTSGQWQRELPAELIIPSIRAGTVWMFHPRGPDSSPVATLTVDGEPGGAWNRQERQTAAVYIHKGIVDPQRRAEFPGLGAAMFDLAAAVGEHHDARFLRGDTWTTNAQLRSYYRDRLGFTEVRVVPGDVSGVLIQRPISARAAPRTFGFDFDVPVRNDLFQPNQSYGESAQMRRLRAEASPGTAARTDQRRQRPTGWVLGVGFAPRDGRRVHRRGVPAPTWRNEPGREHGTKLDL